MVKNMKSAFRPNYAVPPGETLIETMVFKGMTIVDLARRIGQPKKAIKKIMKGEAAITPAIAIQFGRILGVPASFWNNLERNYREILGRLR